MRSFSRRGETPRENPPADGGFVGRSAAAGTDLKLNAEILSNSRSKGIFAGVSLDGAVIQVDKSGDEALYGANVDRHEILEGETPFPGSARDLIRELHGYTPRASGMYCLPSRGQSCTLH
jgi:lipid-binding SYLF domain-containing protein